MYILYHELQACRENWPTMHEMTQDVLNFRYFSPVLRIRIRGFYHLPGIRSRSDFFPGSARDILYCLKGHPYMSRTCRDFIFCFVNFNPTLHPKAMLGCSLFICKIDKINTIHKGMNSYFLSWNLSHLLRPVKDHSENVGPHIRV
jgi:hypothetical protein